MTPLRFDAIKIAIMNPHAIDHAIVHLYSICLKTIILDHCEIVLAKQQLEQNVISSFHQIWSKNILNNASCC